MEIKFRAWDKKNKSWLTDKDNVFLNEEGEAFVLVRGAASDYHSRVDVDIVFFTGLKDKNGKEIYEGDIVLTQGHSDNYPLKYLIVFNIQQSAFRMKWSGRIKEDKDFYDEQIFAPEYKFKVFEVIGNIYENPETLI